MGDKLKFIFTKLLSSKRVLATLATLLSVAAMKYFGYELTIPEALTIITTVVGLILGDSYRPIVPAEEVRAYTEQLEVRKRYAQQMRMANVQGYPPGYYPTQAPAPAQPQIVRAKPVAPETTEE